MIFRASALRGSLRVLTPLAGPHIGMCTLAKEPYILKAGSREPLKGRKRFFEVPLLTPRRPQLQASRASLRLAHACYLARPAAASLSVPAGVPVTHASASAVSTSATRGFRLSTGGRSAATAQAATGASSGASVTDVEGSEVFGASPHLSVPPVILVLDLETTGLYIDNRRIVEIAVRDMRGGENSAMHSLVNPGSDASMDPEAERAHGISLEDVQKPSVPDMSTVGPALLDFVEFRRRVAATPYNATTRPPAGPYTADGTSSARLQAGGFGSAEGRRGSHARRFESTARVERGSVGGGGRPVLPGVMLVAQNGISFDFRVLQSEFERCNVQALPHDWLLFDSLYFMRALYRDREKERLEGSCAEREHEKPEAFNLGSLFDHFARRHPELVRKFIGGRPLKAHRAMADVDMLATVLHCALVEFKVPLAKILERSQTVKVYEAKAEKAAKARKNKSGKKGATV